MLWIAGWLFVILSDTQGKLAGRVVVLESCWQQGDCGPFHLYLAMKLQMKCILSNGTFVH